jgi:ATP-dependent RNA helicase DHX8/PRP22
MSADQAGALEEDRDFSELPVDAYRAEILATLRAERVFICIGETGSGKTTRIPQFCLMEEAACVRPGQLVGVTQPRRVGAISVASRVAAERGGSVGGEVGYSLRFDNRTSAATRIKFMTDGILVRECMADPMLSRYDVIILDEAHERSVHTDVLFALVKMVSARRPELRVVVTSATLDAPRFSAYFGGCPVLRVPGRVFPVDLYHSKTHQVCMLISSTRIYTSLAVDVSGQHVHIYIYKIYM